MWKSSSALIGPKGLLSCPNAGLSSARLVGSIAAEGSPRIGRTAIEKRLRSCTSPQFGSCSENSVIRPKVSGQTLRIFEYHHLGDLDVAHRRLVEGRGDHLALHRALHVRSAT